MFRPALRRGLAVARQTFSCEQRRAGHSQPPYPRWPLLWELGVGSTLELGIWRLGFDTITPSASRPEHSRLDLPQHQEKARHGEERKQSDAEEHRAPAVLVHHDAGIQ